QRPALHPVEVGEPRLAWRSARARDRRAHQRVDQAGFADVGSADQRDLRQPIARKVAGARGARYELGNDLHVEGSSLPARHVPSTLLTRSVEGRRGGTEDNSDVRNAATPCLRWLVGADDASELMRPRVA